jgi:hypothetical protein
VALMKRDEFIKLLETEEASVILKNYMFRGLNLGERQLGIVIDLKNKKVEKKAILSKIKKSKKRGKKNGRCISKN